MKVLMMTPYFEPEITPDIHLMDDVIKSLIKEGHEVIIKTPYPTRQVSNEQRKEYITEKRHETLHGGKLTIDRFPMFREGKNTLMRAFRYVLCCVLSGFYCIKPKADIVFTYSTPPINGLVGIAVSRLKHIPFVYSLQDIFPDSLVNTGLTKKDSILWKIGRIIEDITYKNSDKIIVISEDFKENIMAKGVTENKIELVYNWVDENQVVSVPREENHLFDKYELDRSKFYICYSGNVGFTQNMDMLCDVAKMIEDKNNIGFVIIGDGAYKQKLEEIMNERNIKNITLIPFQDYKDISCVFSLGDAGLIISKKGVGANSVPSKTWSIMSAERPVIASFDKGSELDLIISESKCGICVDADDSGALKAAIIEMYENREGISYMGENGRKFILDNLTMEKGTARIIKILKEI